MTSPLAPVLRAAWVLAFLTAASACPAGPLPCIPGAQIDCNCANGSVGAQLCSPSGAFGACTCSGPVSVDAGTVSDAGTIAVPTANLTGIATLVGRTDWGGTTVAVARTTQTTTTAADGTWTIAAAPLGWVSLSFSNGETHAVLPMVLSEPGSNGIIFDGTLWSLVPMDVPLGQILSGGFIVAPNPTLESAQPPLPALVTQFTDPSSGVVVQEVLSTATGVGSLLEAGASGPLMTSDGTMLVYGLSGASLTLKSLATAGGPPVTLTTTALFSPSLSEIVTSPPWVLTPDGSRVFYSVPDAQDTTKADLMSQPIGGGAEVKLLTYPFLDGLAITVTPDSGSLVACSGGSFELVPTDGSAPAATIFSQAQCHGGAFTPDGQHFVFVTSNTTASAVTVGSNATPIALPGGAALAFSPDSRFVVLDQGNNAVLSTLDGATTLPIEDGGGFVAAFVFTADSQYLVWAGGQGAPPLRLEISTGKTTRLLSPPEGTATIAPAPDGQTVIALEDSVLYAIDIPTAAVTMLAPNAEILALSNPCSPDGTSVAFLENMSPTYTLNVVPIDGSSAPTPLFNTYSIYTSIAGSDFWIDNNNLAVVRSGTPPPYGTLDGVYKVPITP